MQKVLLVVEDDPFVQRFYGRLFKRLPKSITTVFAANGTAALQAVKKIRPNLILLDIMMPDMNGLQVLEKVKSNSQFQETTVVMLTNYGDDFLIAQALEHGATEFLVKSAVSGKELLAVVDKYI